MWRGFAQEMVYSRWGLNFRPSLAHGTHMQGPATAAVLVAAFCVVSTPAGALQVPERAPMRQWMFDADSLLAPAARTGYGAGEKAHFVGLHGHKLTFGTCAPKPWEYKVVEVVEGAYNATAWGLAFRVSSAARDAIQTDFQKENLVLQPRNGKTTQCVRARCLAAPKRAGPRLTMATTAAPQVFAGAQDVAPFPRKHSLHGVQPPHPGETAGACPRGVSRAAVCLKRCAARADAAAQGGGARGRVRAPARGAVLPRRGVGPDHAAGARCVGRAGTRGGDARALLVPRPPP